MIVGETSTKLLSLNGDFLILNNSVRGRNNADLRFANKAEKTSSGERVSGPRPRCWQAVRNIGECVCVRYLRFWPFHFDESLLENSMDMGMNDPLFLGSQGPRVHTYIHADYSWVAHVFRW